MTKSTLFIQNLKALVVSWLMASLLFPLCYWLTWDNTSYGWGVAMMLLGLVMPSVIIPALGLVAGFNWLVFRNRAVFTNRVSLVLLGSLLTGGVFLVIFLLISQRDLAKLLEGTAYVTAGGALFGSYFYQYVFKKLRLENSMQTRTGT